MDVQVGLRKSLENNPCNPCNGPPEEALPPPVKPVPAAGVGSLDCSGDLRAAALGAGWSAALAKSRWGIQVDAPPFVVVDDSRPSRRPWRRLRVALGGAVPGFSA